LFVAVGLRTLCIATATVRPDFYETWTKVYYEASTAIQDREQKLEEAAELIEKVSESADYFHLTAVLLPYLLCVNCWTEGECWHLMDWI